MGQDSGNSTQADARRAVQALWPAAPGGPANLADRLHLMGEMPEVRSPHRLALASASAVGAYAVGVTQWWERMTGRPQSVAIDWTQAYCALNPGHFQEQNGYVLPALSLLSELKADFYRTADGRWFFPIGSYPHLRDGVLDLLQCANSPQALADAIGRWQADELEAAFDERRLPGNYARSAEQWRAHPQGALLAGSPTVQVERIGDAPPEPPRVHARPLGGLRVLDAGHVIAGPVIARSLAEHGAQVLRVDSPHKQDPFRQTVDTNIGKRVAFLDLDGPRDLSTFRHLLANADVMVQSWRHGSLARKGLGPDDAARIRPGIIYVSVTAFGDEGPWASRAGFEQLGQVVTGICATEGGAGRPRMVPTYLLNDYLTGYLGAAGVMQALLRRAEEGGSYHVKVSLAATSMWVQSLGLTGRPAGEPGPHFATGLQPVLEQRESCYGCLTQLPPVAQFSETPARWDLPPVPNGAHRAAWLDI